MATFTLTHGKGPSATPVTVEAFTDLNPPKGTEDFGTLVIRAQLPDNTWVRVIPNPQCPACSKPTKTPNGTTVPPTPGLNELQRLCTSCIVPALYALLEEGSHAKLKTRRIEEEHRGRKVKRDYAVLDLRPKTPKPKGKDKGPEKED